MADDWIPQGPGDMAVALYPFLAIPEDLKTERITLHMCLSTAFQTAPDELMRAARVAWTLGAPGDAVMLLLKDEIAHAFRATRTLIELRPKPILTGTGRRRVGY